MNKQEAIITNLVRNIDKPVYFLENAAFHPAVAVLMTNFRWRPSGKVTGQGKFADWPLVKIG